MFEDEYHLDFFEEKGYQRKKCVECGSHFWTLDEDKETCEDTPCVEFDFIGDPPAERELSVSDVRDFFIEFFDEREHTPLEPYPVTARWRDDVFLVHASIYDFQPHVTSGLVEPPANPLVVSQPCIRLPDVDEVGKTGKHLTSFEMMGHHAFNSPDNYVYWKEETVRYCHEMLVELGVPEEEIVYKEYPWIGGGNAGPSLEVNIQGLEVATLVFMNMEKDPKGDIELDGDMYSSLNLNVVDTGYGVERWAWISDGAPTIYDSIYPDVIRYICDQAGVEHPLYEDWYREMLEEYTKIAARQEKDFTDDELIRELIERLDKMGYDLDMEDVRKRLERIRYVYTLGDHARTIGLMLADGVVPSNVEEGYLARMMIRRSLRHIESLDPGLSLKDLVEKQMDKFNDIIDEGSKELVFDILDLEIEKYEETVERGKKLITRKLEDMEGEELSLDSLIEFYDTHGIHPTIVKELAKEYDVAVDIPDDFNSLLAERHEEAEETAEEEKGTSYDLSDTRKLYYENPDTKEFEAVVLHSSDTEVVLDQTLFYPEGGGQPSDRGLLHYDGGTAKVEKVEIHDGVIVHKLDDKIPEGETVKGEVDWKRRMDLTRHHTATHIIISSARKVLGKHIWQRGAQKGVENARLDLSHYKRISREEIKEIERIANEIVLEDIPVLKEELTRDEAEERFGFELYQGGVPTSDIIRVVHISDVQDYDAQACGGTHCSSTAEVGEIKILNTQRIQDGVERLTFSAGMATVEEFQRQEDLLLDTADKFNVGKKNLPETAERFFREWKERGKELEKLKEYRSMALADELLPGEMEDGIEFVVSTLDMETKEMLKIAEDITSQEGRVVLLASEGEKVQLVFSRSEDLDFDMTEVLNEAAREVNGGGGGSPRTAQGGGNKPEGREKALEKAKKIVKEKLG